MGSYITQRWYCVCKLRWVINDKRWSLASCESWVVWRDWHDFVVSCESELCEETDMIVLWGVSLSCVKRLTWLRCEVWVWVVWRDWHDFVVSCESELCEETDMIALWAVSLSCVKRLTWLCCEVFLPNDDQFTWILAKMWFNNADANVHQALCHFGKVYLCSSLQLLHLTST